MKEVLNINLFKIPDQSITAHGSSAGFIKELHNPGQSFSGFLSEHISNFANNPINRAEENSNKDIFNRPLSGNEAIFTSNDRLMENQINLRDENNFHSVRNETEGVGDKVTIRSKNDSEASAGDRKERVHKDDTVSKDNSIRRKKTDDKPEGLNSDEIALFLRDIGIILEMLKGLSHDKKVNELKSALLALKNSLESLNAGTGKNRFILANETEIKNLSGQLKSLIKSLNENIDKGHINKNIINTADNRRADNTDSKEVKIEPVNLIDLKKQITKLTEEIKQYLNNKKSESIAGKYDEISNDNKNPVSQKAIRETITADKADVSQARDNPSNYNFSFFRKETEGIGSWQKINQTTTSQKSSAFSEQLNDIAQYAKIVVRDSKNGSFSIRLHPESLGRVNINLNLEQGVIIGKFLVESAVAKELMLENIQTITDRLREDGISVGEFHVNVRDENKSFLENDNNTERVYYNDPLQALTAGAEYETNSLYIHNGEIDLLI